MSMFGAKTGGFGTTFGAQNTATFGSSTPFGQNSAGFGSPAAFGTQTPATGGLFGSGATANTGGLFGQTSTSTFGQQVQQPSGGFGGFTPSTSSNLFGQTTQASSLFSTPATNSTFGAKTPGGFGAFGNTTTSTNLFGNQQNAGGSLFGASSSALFGGATAVPTNGTTVKYNAPQGTDTMVKNGVSQNISTRHQCITAMKEYEGKCLEELRMEDYSNNRKGKQPGSSSLFGSTGPTTQTSAFGFGSQNKTTGFGATGGFGTQPSTAGGGLFGSTQPQQQSATGGLFGQQNKSLFGTTSTGFGMGQTPQASANVFGQNQQQNKSLFGANPTTQATGGLFGATNTSTFGTTTGFGGFGTTTQATGGLFGKPAFGTTTTTAAPSAFNFGGQAATGGLFSKPATTGAFNFGAPNTATTGFGGQATTGLFGSKPTTGFGTANTGLTGSTFGTGFNAGNTSLFGANQAKPAFNFGQANSTFGTTSLGLGGGLGGNTNTTFSFGNATSNLGSAATGTVTSQDAQIKQQLMALTNSPYGDSPLFWNLKQGGAKREEILKPTNPAAQKAVLNASSQYKVSPRPSAKIKPKSLHSLMNGSKSQIFDGLEEDDFSFGNDTFVPRKSVKKLVIKNQGAGSVSSGNRVSHTDDFTDQRQFSEEPCIPPPVYDSPQTSVHMTSINVPDGDYRNLNPLSDPHPPNNVRVETPQKRLEFNETITVPAHILHETSVNHSGDRSLLQTHSLHENSVNHSGDRSLLQTEEQAEQDEHLPAFDAPPHPAGIVLQRPGYYCVPSLDELAILWTETGQCLVENFTIGREGFGSIFFPGITNVAGLNLDEIVHFRRKEVIVYPEDDVKPEMGEGLNKRAEVTLDCVWPVNKVNKSPIKNPDDLRKMSYQEKIELASAKLGAKFVDYRPETGSWVFEVKHFSKYGLLDDSDDEEMSEQDRKKLKILQQKNLAVQKQKLSVFPIHGKDPNVIDVEQIRELDPRAILPTDIPQGDNLPAREDTPMMDEEDAIPRGDYQTDQTDSYMPSEMDVMGDGDEPSSHRLATSMGVNARRMQIMKASFFSDENTTDHVPIAELAHPVMSEIRSGSPLIHNPEPLVRHTSLFGSALKSKYPVPVRREKKTLLGDHHMEAENIFAPRIPSTEVLKPVQSFFPLPPEHVPIPSGMVPERPRLIVGSRKQRALPDTKESLMYNRQGLLTDAGCFMGRSFRVGWGPGWTLVHSGQPAQAPEAKKMDSLMLLHGQSGVPIHKVGESPWKVTIETVNVNDYFSSQDELLLNNHRHGLEVQLDNAVYNDETGSPLFYLGPGPTALHQYAQKSKKDLELIGSHPELSTLTHIEMVYNLCVALWGNLPGLDREAMLELDINSYSYHQSRREALSRWLSEVCGKTLTDEMHQARFKSESHLKVVLSMLSARKIKEACSLAQKSGDHRLALLLAQAVGNHVPRQMIAQQLANWCELKADKYIDLDRLKIYLLLSGQLVWLASDRMVNVCDQMDWKKAFAYHLWFQSAPSSVLSDAVSQYDVAYQGSEAEEKYAVSPRPPYLESEVNVEEDKDFTIHDTCYHLLKLYCDRSHSLESLLSPVTSTANQLDYRLSWHLCQVLQSLGYLHISDYHISLIHTSYAAQLESLGLWQWATFVLLHISDADRRKKSVMDLLSRNIGLSEDRVSLELEKLLVERFHVPKEWIHEAKALRARYVGESHAEAWHLLKAKYWDESHKVILKDIAADAIINENYDYLKHYLVELKGGLIEDWHTGGSVFLDYINLCQQLDTLKQGEPSVFEVEKLQPEVISLCNRVGSMKCPTAKDRLCQCEMAKKAANLLRTIVMLQKENPPDHVPVRLLAPHISHLPMPEDYSMQELRQMTRSYMLEMNCA